MKPSEVNVDNILYDNLKAKKYKNGQESKQARMSYNKLEFIIQTPLGKVPFGLNIGEELDSEGKPVKNSTKPKKYSFEFNIIGTPALEEFKALLQKINDKNVAHIVSKSKEWWGEEYTPVEIRKLCYNSLVKIDKKGDYPERFKVKLPFNNGKPEFKVYDQNNKKIDWYTVTQKDGKDFYELDWSWAQNNMQIETLASCEGLWEVNKKVFCTFRVKQVRVRPPEELPECAFDDVRPGEKSKKSADVDLKVNDEEDQEEQDEENVSGNGEDREDSEDES